jgi:hypothetical protein
MIHARNPDWGSAYAASLQGKLRMTVFRERRSSPADFSRWGANSMPADRAAESLAKSPMPRRVSALGFELVNYPNPFAVAIPFWFLVPLTGMLAAVPWVRIPWRFSLRTLLIAITLIAFALGAIVVRCQ